MVIIYSFNLNISPKMSYGVLECDIIMLQNYVLMLLYKKEALFVLDAIYLFVRTLSVYCFLLLIFILCTHSDD